MVGQRGGACGLLPVPVAGGCIIAVNTPSAHAYTCVHSTGTERQVPLNLSLCGGAAAWRG